jgi:hypothetical protein
LRTSSAIFQTVSEDAFSEVCPPQARQRRFDLI